MKQGLSPLGMLGTIIVMLVAAGVFLAILFQGINPDTITSLQSCDEGVIANVAGPVLGDINDMKCFNNRFKPTIPKDGECPDGFGDDKDNSSQCIASGEESWQYLLKMGCTDEAPYCWAQTDKAISVGGQTNSNQQTACTTIYSRAEKCEGKNIGDEITIDGSGNFCATCEQLPSQSEGFCVLSDRYQCD